MQDNELLFLSGNDVPFIEAQLVIHQPTIKEIAYIGEEAFFTGCELLNFSKNILSEEDKVNLENKSDFDILIAILRERNAVMQRNKDCVQMVLALLFPEYTIDIAKDSIVFKKPDEEVSHYINDDNFEQFKVLLNKIFAFGDDSIKGYNPKGELAREIADKLNKRHQKLAEANPQKGKIDILNRYVSILAVGSQKDMNSLLNYTVYQLFDEFKRFQLKMGYDIYLRAKMAGAKDLKEVEDWMKDIHSE